MDVLTRSVLCRFVKQLSDAIYDFIMVKSLLAQIALLALVPYVGTLASFCLSCWTYSFSFFEYVAT